MIPNPASTLIHASNIHHSFTDAESFYEYLDKVTGVEIDRVSDDLRQQGYSHKVFGKVQSFFTCHYLFGVSIKHRL